MNLKFTNPILPIGEIKIPNEFYPPRLEKLKKCMDFYRENGYFDRHIIVDGDKTLRDGYCAYMTAYLLDVETVKVDGRGKGRAVITASDKQEPLKLYCVKDYHPGTWCTKGKVYEAGEDGRVTFDSREKSIGGWREGVSIKWIKEMVLLVNRPAKVGEWVYVTDVDYTTCNDREPGDIFLIDGSEDIPCRSGNGFIWGSGLYPQGAGGGDGGHYLVLDGYKGDTE